MDRKAREAAMCQVLDAWAERFSDQDIAGVETCLVFLRASRDLYDYFDGYFARYGLSQGRFSLLVTLWLSGGATSPGELAEMTFVSRATVTGHLDGLERAGLVTREAHTGDGRMLTGRLTRAGESLLERILPEHLRRVADLLAGLTEAERRQLTALSAKLSERALALTAEK